MVFVGFPEFSHNTGPYVHFPRFGNSNLRQVPCKKYFLEIPHHRGHSPKPLGCCSLRD